MRRKKLAMRSLMVTDSIMVALNVVYNPGGWHDYYEVEVQERLPHVNGDTWVKKRATGYREYHDALLAFEQKQRDIAAEIILDE
jgi:hypothetical protein